jgi:hypothetical protein
MAVVSGGIASHPRVKTRSYLGRGQTEGFRVLRTRLRGDGSRWRVVLIREHPTLLSRLHHYRALRGQRAVIG